MHRATPLNSSFRAYSAGGARSVIPTVDDAKFMQESTDSHGMRGEKIPTMEAPQNYGFTSVVADADKSGNPGSITDSAEGFISFMGGNRSFPVMGVMDDRRHRLLNLAKDAAKGSTAMFGLKEWGQQLLNTKDGWFMTGNTEKKMRLQLVENKQQQQSQQQQANAGGGGGGGSSSSSSTQKGQKSLHKEESKTFVEATKDHVHTVRGNGNVIATDTKTLTYHKDQNKSTRADDQHTHIKNGVSIWVAGGCFSDMPIMLKKDSCKSDSAGAKSSGSGSGSST
jgi:phage gp45-like